jgi:hypothetical protein
VDSVFRIGSSGGAENAGLQVADRIKQRNKWGSTGTIDGRDMGRSKDTNLVKNFLVSHFSEKGANTWT